MSLLGRPAMFIGKKELFDIPIYGRILYENGNIAVARTNRDQAVSALKDAALQCKKEKKTVGIYPEGTRRRKPSIGNMSQLLPFKKGGFYLAKDADASIIPVVHIGCHRLFKSWFIEWGKLISR
jgi:1-acyl-sn-glycerol-3-phosphate acyltransferase